MKIGHISFEGSYGGLYLVLLDGPYNQPGPFVHFLVRDLLFNFQI
jgi:hypothetical protein